MKMAKVEDVMYYLLGQDYKTRTDQPKIWNKNVKGKGRWQPRKSQQAYGAEDYDPEYEEEFEDAYARPMTNPMKRTPPMRTEGRRQQQTQSSQPMWTPD